MEFWNDLTVSGEGSTFPDHQITGNRIENNGNNGSRIIAAAILPAGPAICKIFEKCMPEARSGRMMHVHRGIAALADTLQCTLAAAPKALAVAGIAPRRRFHRDRDLRVSDTSWEVPACLAQPFGDCSSQQP